MILGVWGGAAIGDCIAVTLVIRRGYVASVMSAPTLLFYWLCGAFAGFCIGCLSDALMKKSPSTFLWITWAVLSVGYWIMLRIPFESMAR